MTDLGIPGLDDVTEIGRGGFGVVYRARQTHADRYVAVKLLLVPLGDDRSHTRFRRESRAMGALSGHPNVVVLYEFGITGGGSPYLILEYLSAGSLADRIRTSGPLSVDEATAMAVQVAGALESAHRLGVLHRDVKPENILVGMMGEPKLGDFGIAHVDTSTSTTGATHLSPAHSPPEILDGHAASVRSDVYSLGSTLYMLLSGRPAFVNDGDHSVLAVMARIANSQPPDLRAIGIPDGVWSVVAAAMAKDSGERPATAEAFAEQLNEARSEIGLSPIVVPIASPTPGGSRIEPDDFSREAVITGPTVDLDQLPRPWSEETVAATPGHTAYQPPPSKPDYVAPSIAPKRASANTALWIAVPAAIVVAVFVTLAVIVSRPREPTTATAGSSTSASIRRNDGGSTVLNRKKTGADVAAEGGIATANLTSTAPPQLDLNLAAGQLTCEGKGNQLSASGSLTNKSGVTSDYEITVEFRQNNASFTSGQATVSGVSPDATTGWTITVTADITGQFSCKVVRVNRYDAGTDTTN